jgi:DNA-binding NarL/FixJ family response regulator
MRVVRVAQTLDVDDIRASGPEALFVDTDFLEIDPADAVSAMRAALPRAFICAYTDGHGGARADRLRFAGANCVLSKRSGAGEITDALRAARQRGTFTDPRCD